MSTPELLGRLQRHYIKPGLSLPGGIFLPEVGWNGGAGGGCDAIYVGFTTTSGRILVGHELKVSRADWLNELNKPGKSDPWADQCHEWWLVVNDPAIVHPGELPAHWGLMVPGTSKTRMKIHTRAVRKDPTTHCPSWQAVRSIMARQDTLRSQAIANVRNGAREEAGRELRQRVEDEVSRRMRNAPDAELLREQMRQITEALGGQILFDDRPRGYYYGREIGLPELAAIGELCREHRNLRKAIDDLTAGYTIGNVRRAVDQLERAIVNLRAVPGQQMELTS
ncbi:Uncharacterised protein [Mycolicibacterium vanbaalenii]|uniref:Uncharacterized protein n=1 Tax=Mycolicibacterium vanbaalenii TaxID=110539 RepID=A0A5S9R676_MYCVN|nr:hypothetical protein [Mycolicibacterium vanbaalenii]CAA0129295.1 Uncharacterised protein [Mycolicibacterium vanbaalenii]